MATASVARRVCRHAAQLVAEIEHLFCSLAHQCGARLPRTCAPPEAFPVIDIHRPPLYRNDQSDRWLMQTVLEHSSSHPVREAAAAWVGAYDAALALGTAVSQAQVVADAAFRSAATIAGLSTGDWRLE
jgi:hypothetical protein